MKKTIEGKFHFIQEGECVAELDGSLELGDSESKCFAVQGQLCFPFLESIHQDGPNSDIPKAPEPEVEQLNLDGSTNHVVRIECGFTLPKGIALEDEEQNALCQKTAGFFSFMVNEIVVLKTGKVSAADFIQSTRTTN